LENGKDRGFEDSYMPNKTPGRPRKRATKATASLREAAEKADQYIAEQLKAMYDSVAVEPVPDRLLELLDRLDSQAKE
jgi:Anti-sigma factor NepR